MMHSNGEIERISDLERQYVNEVLNTGFRSSMGSLMMNRLERFFIEKFGMQYAISFINGTATMHAALCACDVGPGDEVIVPPLTMSSTTFAVLQAQAVPVFADIDPDTFLMDPASVKERVTPRTKAMIPVALYGLSPDMEALMTIAGQHDLTVIEDDAQAMLGTYRGQLIGTIGHMSSFSFQSSKHLTSGEGGMILTNDMDLAQKVRRFGSLGYAGVGANKGKITKTDIQDPNYARHVEFGYNYRIPELCAAVTLAQCERMDQLVNRRIHAAQLFLQAIKDCPWLLPQVTPAHCTNSYWSLAVRLVHPDITWHQFRDKFRALGGDNFYAAWRLTYLEPMFAQGSPVRHPAYQGEYQNLAPGLCPNAEIVQPQLIQFKTNYWKWDEAQRNADILARTIRAFD